jgi:vanillate/4-hydroxybenzoate decarboxylase subunit D
MWSFPRPEEPTLSVDRTPVDGACPACGAERLAAYPVMSEGGWWNVVKCQSCLTSVERVRGPRLGSYQPLGVVDAS